MDVDECANCTELLDVLGKAVLSTCSESVSMALNRTSSASLARLATVGVFTGRSPARTIRCKNLSRRSLSLPLVKPHQAGDAYINRATVVERATWNRACVGSPCARRVLSAYREEEQEPSIRSMCSVIASFSPIVLWIYSPRIFIEVERCTPVIDGCSERDAD